MMLQPTAATSSTLPVRAVVLQLVLGRIRLLMADGRLLVGILQSQLMQVEMFTYLTKTSPTIPLLIQPTTVQLGPRLDKLVQWVVLGRIVPSLWIPAATLIFPIMLILVMI